jgi:hypothetical protein
MNGTASIRQAVLYLASEETRGRERTESILASKSILAVNCDPKILPFLEKKIDQACPVYTFDRATTLEETRGALGSYTYDLVLLGMADLRTFRALGKAFRKDIPVVMIADPILPREALDGFTQMGVRAFLPKGKLEEIVPFLEDVLSRDCLSGWRCQLNRLGRVLNTLLNSPF